MMSDPSIESILQPAFAQAIAQVAGRPVESVRPQIRPAGDPKHGDYQCNDAMALAKALGDKPRSIAEKIKAVAEPLLADVAEPLEIAGPGFINIRLKDSYLARALGAIPAPPASGDDRVGLPRVERPLRVVVEYSQPNIAKQMHVGHLRSTIIGDVFARVLSALGHDVVRQNHIGDWGTQFGLLIRWYRERPLPQFENNPDVLEAIEADYRAANERDKSDPQFAREAREAVAQLQSGDPEARRVWEQICAASWRAFTETYERLGCLLRPEDVRGESFYNDRLAGVIADLRAALPERHEGTEARRHEGEGTGNREQGTDEHRRPGGATNPNPDREGVGTQDPDRCGAPGEGRDPRPDRQGGRSAGYSVVRIDQGAVCVFLYNADGTPRYKAADDKPLPVIIQKSDGAYLYSTTDLAAIRYRVHELRFPTGVGAQRVIYVTDARQKLHFQMFLAVARDAGWVPVDVEVDHVTFGSVLGADRKPLKTRAGGTIKLRELIDESYERAAALLAAREPTDTQPEPEGQARSKPDSARLTDAERQEIARRVGVASIKYSDLRNDRNADYIFDWDKMIALQGNTAPYMMYAYARIRSIYRKAAERTGAVDVYGPAAVLRVEHPTERAVMLRLLRFRETVDAVARELLPHILCGYLYELAGEFMKFYENCPVLDAPDDATRLSRMRLCDLTARTLKLGLGLLGIEALERM